MTDSERTAREHSDEQARTSPGAKAPGETKPHAGEQAASGAKGAGGREPAGDGRGHGGHGGAVELNGDAAEVQGDLDQLVKTSAERDEYLALAQRTQADFENYRKRVARESASAQARGCIMLAKELLPALDNLDRALEAAAKDDPLLDGVRLVRAELSAALARSGIESFSPAGEVFDPSVHEAVATSEQPADGAPSGTVVEVYQPGYRLAETIIRPARVVVAA
ncbi:MAG TPA: nucleotide exchange factor GrpE [Solirubrobacteraceae bacterium]|jgi:molecular chaperone GrpE|nr:nucleotide exchange factor GrpE [Solirubrobacteraceae bacterium]